VHLQQARRRDAAHFHRSKKKNTQQHHYEPKPNAFFLFVIRFSFFGVTTS